MAHGESLKLQIDPMTCIGFLLVVGRAELHFFSDADALAKAVAAKWLEEIEQASRAGKPHAVALSGGRIAQKFFSETVKLAEAKEVSLAHVQFFWADERCVPPTDAESNFKIAQEILLTPLKISPDCIHRLRGEELPDEAVKIAEAELKKIFKNADGVPVLDLIFLGMGEDGHVASLFQNAMPRYANCNDFFLFVDDSPKPPPRRLTVNLNVIAAAAKVWVLASGTGKELALKDSLNGKGHTPLANVIQMRAETEIFTDIQFDKL